MSGGGKRAEKGAGGTVCVPMGKQLESDSTLKARRGEGGTSRGWKVLGERDAKKKGQKGKEHEDDGQRFLR